MEVHWKDLLFQSKCWFPVDNKVVAAPNAEAKVQFGVMWKSH